MIKKYKLFNYFGCNCITNVIQYIWGVIMNRENKSELIHIRIEPEIKQKSEEIFKQLGVSTSYAVSMFLSQVIMRNGFPFDVEIPSNQSDVEKLASIIEATGGNGEISDKNKKIIHLLAIGDIDYETAVFAIKRSFKND